MVSVASVIESLLIELTSGDNEKKLYEMNEAKTTVRGKENFSERFLRLLSVSVSQIVYRFWAVSDSNTDTEPAFNNKDFSSIEI